MESKIEQRIGSRFNVRYRNRECGQGMTEYIIIVALIAIAAIGIFGKFGDVVSNQMAATTQELAGRDGQQETASAEAAGTAAGIIQTQRPEISLNNFADNGANDQP